MTGWRLGELRDEAVRSIGYRHIAAGIITALVCVGLIAVGALDLSRAIAHRHTLEEGGISVYVAQTMNPNDPLDAAACARIASGNGVLAAGGYMGENTTADAEWQPSGIRVQLVDLTLGALQVWWPDAPAAGGLFVGNDLAATIGIGESASVTIDGVPLTVQGTLPETVKSSIVQASVVRVVPALGNATECWYRTAPGAAGPLDELASAAFPNQLVGTKPFLEPGTGSITPREILTSGPSALAWPIALGIAVLLWAALGIMDRRETAVYRSLGTSRAEFAALLLIRFVVVALPLACLAVVGSILAYIMLGNAWDPDLGMYLLQPVVVFLLGSLVLAVLLPTLTALGAVANAIRE